MIEVRGVVKYRGSQRVLDQVSLRVEKGEIAVIIGPSGGGKSTLLRCINGLDSFEEGEVQVDDLLFRPEMPSRQRSELLRRVRRRVALVFQQFNLFPHMTVLKNVMSGPLYVLNQDEEEAEPEATALLARVGLSDKLHARPDQLSGGQQQRVAIARALAMKPEAILFDEPTSALDPKMAREVLSVITDLAHMGQTMIVVTHAMNFAQRVAHQVHVMVEGRIAESGQPRQLFENARLPATRSFLEQVQDE